MPLKYIVYFSVFLLLSGAGFHAQAQNSDVFRSAVRVANANTLLGQSGEVRLWGVERVEGLSASLKARARFALEEALGGEDIRCRVLERAADSMAAQCMGKAEEDLALLMLRGGFVSADRAKIYGSVFEEAYIAAEAEARRAEQGIWAESNGGDGGHNTRTLLILLGFVLFLFVVVTFAVMHTIIRGFEKVSASQDRHVDMIGRERALKDKERAIVATMLDSEIKANKSKIEAYLIVYEEMLAALKNPERQPKYKKTGDIVQKQPALDRSVFDGNTDKLDVLGDRLSSEVVHFYARIKTKPDYLNLEQDMPLEEAVMMVEKGVQNARRMNEASDRIIEAFNKGGLDSEQD